MPEANVVREHMEIIGSDGVHVGTVDAVEEHCFKLTKAGGPDGEHHYLSTAHVKDIKGNTVTLTVSGAEAISSED